MTSKLSRMSSSDSRTTCAPRFGCELDQPFGGEQAKGLAQRRARHAEAVAQHPLVEPRAGRELAFDDQVAQLVGDGWRAA